MSDTDMFVSISGETFFRDLRVRTGNSSEDSFIQKKECHDFGVFNLSLKS